MANLCKTTVQAPNGAIKITTDERGTHMLTWITENIATIIIGTLLLAVVAYIVIKMIADAKQGKSACGCSGCKNCNMECSHCGK